MGNNEIQFKDTVRFLGLIFDTHLNWKAHIANTKAKCNSALNLMLKLSHTTWGARRQTLLMLYKALVLSRIDYGSPIYGSASPNTLKSLNSIQTKGLRLCSGAFKSSPNSSVVCESGELPLSLHRDLVTIKRVSERTYSHYTDHLVMLRFVCVPEICRCIDTIRLDTAGHLELLL